MGAIAILDSISSVLCFVLCYYDRQNEMNIFVLDPDPYVAATYLHPKLLVKMPLEGCQMLAAAFSHHHLNWGVIHKKDGSPYKVTHRNHPCTLWVVKRPENMAWLIAHTRGILREYTEVYGKIHGCEAPLYEAISIFKEKTGRYHSECWKYHSPFIVAAPPEFKAMADPIEAYRAYMQTKSYATWDKYPELKPSWWGNDEN